MLVQPKAEPVTEYAVLVVGLTVNVFPFVEPGIQVYVIAPVAVKVADCPEQIEELVTVTVGLLFTVTDVVPEPLHTPEEPFTV